MGRTKVSGFLLIIVSLRGFAVCGRRNCIANPGIQLGTERSVPFRCNLLSLFEEKVGNRRAHVRLSLSCPPQGMLLQRNDNSGRGLYATHRCLQCNISRAESGGYGQVDLINSRCRQTRERS
jgi:hypothetical protein